MIPLDYFIGLVVAVVIGGIIGYASAAQAYGAYIGFLLKRIAELGDGSGLPRDPEAEDEWWKGNHE